MDTSKRTAYNTYDYVAKLIESQQTFWLECGLKKLNSI